MEKFEFEQDETEDRLRVRKSGPDLLRFPLFNKGTGFTHDERRALGIEALLPAGYSDIDTQSRRIFRSIFYNRDDIGRNIGLAMLQDRNEVLFYKVLHDHLEEVMPIVYTPTVGAASQYYSRVFRRGRGLFITPDHSGRIEQVLRAAAPFSDVKLMVVTDNEAILGIGDQGAGGMAISVGKLALYCAGAGIHPAATLPISLDVGTDNQELLDDPLYLGYRKERLRGERYDALIDEFVFAAKAVFPDVVIQWEDFRKDNALAILDRHRDSVPSFNDDIQGTGAVASACVQSACRIIGSDFKDSRIVIYGAGAAGLGIARQIRQQLGAAGLSKAEQTAAVLVMDSRGIVSHDRDGLDSYKKELAWDAEQVAALRLDIAGRKDLAQVVAAYRATALIGASGQGGAFDRSVVAAMLRHTSAPTILPMSNPTSISEATPADLLQWTDNKALVATGSPFDPVPLSDKPNAEQQTIGQANNVFVFPGIGLGAIASGARVISDGMISASGKALAESLTADELRARRLVPDLSRLWTVCGQVAIAVAQAALDEGVCNNDITISVVQKRLNSMRWTPRYPRIEQVWSD